MIPAAESSRGAAAVPRIELSGVARSFGGVAVLRSLDLTIRRGELVALVGQSGCGKTTTLKLINRLLEPDAGGILIDGESTGRGTPHALRRRIGYVFQRAGLFPHLTVGENIGVTPRLLGWVEARIAERTRELLTLVRLPSHFARRYPDALSGGQRQRVGVARALAARPSIMLMDEPFGALDPVTRGELGSDYRRLHAEMGLTTVMVTHDVLEAVLLADRLLVMDAGTIIADGTAGELGRHGDPRVRALFEIPRLQAERVTDLLSDSSEHE